MRLMYKTMKQYFKDMNPEPNWVKEIKDKHAKDQEALEILGGSAAMSNAISRLKPAPGDLGGLGDSKPIPTKSKKFNPKTRGIGDIP